MAFKLESNPLENNALFAPAQPAVPAKPAEKPAKRAKKSPAKDTAKQTEAPQRTAEPIQSDAPYIRATFIVRQDLLKHLKDYAYTERREIKDVINEILEDSLERIAADYKKKGKTLLEK